SGNQPARENLDGVDVHRYVPAPERPGKTGFVLEFAIAWVKIFALTVRVFARDGFAAVQACNPPDIFFTAGFPYTVARCRFVFAHHDLAPELFTARFGRDTGLTIRILRIFERLTYRFANHVIAVNEPQRDIARRRSPKDPARVTIVRNGPMVPDTAPARV